jgi:hypothetical protein
MFFSAGIPMLSPICAASMGIMYVTDKWLLLRCYKKPWFDPSFAKICCTYLPYAALLHMINAFWMLGCNELLLGSKSPIADTFIEDMLVGVDPFGDEGFAAKIARVHCLPYAFFFGVILIRSLMPRWLIAALTTFANLYETTINAMSVCVFQALSHMLWSCLCSHFPLCSTEGLEAWLLPNGKV